MKRSYKYKRFKPASLVMIAEAEEICEEYAAAGYDLTLRQLYYQFVARDLIENSQKAYNRLGAVISDARMAGLLDWSYIEDRTRNLASLPHWTSPAEVLRAAAQSYALDRWESQPYRVEVWVEKEALAGVVAQAADALDVPYFSCRGYVSQSEMWNAAQRIGRNLALGAERVLILHLGDHDPSGIDMTRDISERLRRFLGVDFAEEALGAMNGHDRYDLDEGEGYDLEDLDEVARADLLASTRDHMNKLEVRRIALNMDQIEEHQPPPNPAKVTDARFEGYREVHGDESWELDAMPPDLLDGLIRTEVSSVIEGEEWDRVRQQEKDDRKRLQRIASDWR